MRVFPSMDATVTDFDMQRAPNQAKTMLPQPVWLRLCLGRYLVDKKLAITDVSSVITTG
jgi:hypothetical protein